jgi:hypothetical protein
MDHRRVILEQLRRCVPVLERLTLWWPDMEMLIRHSALSWLSVRELNIPSASLIEQLANSAAFPHLRYLSFGSRRFRLNPPGVLAEWILLWLDNLVSVSSSFTILHLDRCCPYSIDR